MRTEKIGSLLAKVRRSGKIKSSEYLEDGEFPIIDQGAGEIAGFSNESEFVHRIPLPIIIFGDHTRRVKYSEEPFICGADGTQLLYPNDESIDLEYFYYAIKNVDLSNYFYARHFKFLKDQKINLPPPEIQRLVAEKLRTYDKLIKNNRRRIALLEESARLLYREWFVANQWKDTNSESSTKIRTRPLKEVANLTMGQSPASKFYNKISEGLPFHQGVTDYGVRFVEDRVYSTQITKIANPSDILLSVRAPVGRINITKNKIVLGRGLAALNSKFGSNSFLFYALKSFFFKEDIIGTGSIYAATTKDQLEKIEIADPPREQIERFETLVSPIDQQIISLWKINQKLTEARDMLLPRLMDGRITV